MHQRRQHLSLRQVMANLLHMRRTQSPNDWFVIDIHQANRFISLLNTEDCPGSRGTIEVIRSQLNINPRYATGFVRLYGNRGYLQEWIDANRVEVEDNI